MSARTTVAGVGMIPFVKPGANAPYHVMGAEAAALALKDAGIDYGKVQQAYVGYVYGDSTCGQRALYPVGMTGTRLVITLLYEMRRRGATLGAVTLCVGGGQGAAMVFERV